MTSRTPGRGRVINPSVPPSQRTLLPTRQCLWRLASRTNSRAVAFSFFLLFSLICVSLISSRYGELTAADGDVELHVLGCRVDILGTSCDQCLSMVQCRFTSTETARLIRTGSPATSTFTQLLNSELTALCHSSLILSAVGSS